MNRISIYPFYKELYVLTLQDDALLDIQVVKQFFSKHYNEIEYADGVFFKTRISIDSIVLDNMDECISNNMNELMDIFFRVFGYSMDLNDEFMLINTGEKYMEIQLFFNKTDGKKVYYADLEKINYNDTTEYLKLLNVLSELKKQGKEIGLMCELKEEQSFETDEITLSEDIALLISDILYELKLKRYQMLLMQTGDNNEGGVLLISFE